MGRLRVLSGRETCQILQERTLLGPMPTISWQGTVLAVQPRIRLTRSFDERTHTYLGYALRLELLARGPETPPIGPGPGGRCPDARA